MLQGIRDNSQGVIAKVIVGLIVAVFALWGVESIIGGFVASPPVAEVNGEEINDLQLQAGVQQLLFSIGADAGAIDPGLVEDLALDQLIDEVVLRQAAERSDLAISSARIDRFILNSPQFQINGVFDSELAVRTMVSNNLSVQAYREDLGRRMVLSQVASAYAGSNFMTPGEIEQLIELQQQTRSFRYVAIPMGTRTLGTAIGDERISEYYERNQEDFREQESVVARYVVLDKDVIAEEIEVSAEELQARFEVERSEFQGSAEKRASHILFETFGISEEQALEQARAARQRLDDGEAFAALALELSSDVISGEAGGDIGYTDGTAFPAEVEEALGELELEEISGPVVSEFGVHLVQLTEDSENQFPPFEEVSARIERDLKSSEVELIYSARLEDMSNLAFESGDLVSISEQLDLPVLTSEAFGRIGGADVFSNPALVTAAFSDEVLLDGNNSDVVELDESRSAVVRVERFNESIIRPLDEVEAEIAVLLRSEMEREAAADLANEVLTALEASEEVSELLAANELEWIEESEVGRTGIQVNQEIVQHVFGMPRPDESPLNDSVVLSNGTSVVIELFAVNPGSLEDVPEEQRLTLTRSIAADLGTNDFEGYLSTLRENADVTRQQTQF